MQHFKIKFSIQSDKLGGIFENFISDLLIEFHFILNKNTHKYSVAEWNGTDRNGTKRNEIESDV